MARLSAWRVAVLIMIFIPCAVGVWAAYLGGRAALGGVGGALVAFVAALMLAAIVGIAGIALWKPTPRSPRSRAVPPPPRG